MGSKIAKTRIGEIEYQITGSGTPILFVHGGHSNCYETLAHKGFDTDNYQLINPSRPGYGKTPLKHFETPEQASDLIVALLDSLGIKEVIVYGISAGGLTALELAAKYPSRVSKLVMASAISKEWLDKNGKVYKAAKKMFHPKMEKYTWAIIRFFAKLFPRMIANSFYPQFSKKSAHPLNKREIDALIASFKHMNSKTGFMNDIEQNIDDHILSRITCPTLIIHSENDNSVSIDHANHAHQMIKNSSLEIINNEWGHLFWIGKDSNDIIQKTIRFIEE